MEQFVQKRYQTLSNTLNLIPEMKNLSVKNPGIVADAVKLALSDLKIHFAENPFADQNEQIQFFKYEKPKFYGEYIYALELFTIESNKPHAEETIIKKYYEHELHFIKRFFDQYRFLYQYYLLDGMELDAIYFIPGRKNKDLLIPEAPDADLEFSTPGDFLFAKFLALERIQEYLMKLLYPVSNPANSDLGRANNTLRWTGDKINLVELAYGIYNTAQVSDGQAHIIDIISWLENSFQVKLSRYFQMFAEIKNRKSVSKTRYLDHMSKMISLYIEQGDAFVPQKPKPVSGSKPVIRK
jgi:hypothetical protein